MIHTDCFVLTQMTPVVLVRSCKETKLKSVKKCLSTFLKFAITFRLFIVQLPFKYCQKSIQERIFNIYRKKARFLNKTQFSIKKMRFAPKRPTAFKILENNLGYFYFKSSKFYLCLLVEKLQRIKVRVLQNYVLKHSFKFIHLMM